MVVTGLNDFILKRNVNLSGGNINLDYYQQLERKTQIGIEYNKTIDYSYNLAIYAFTIIQYGEGARMILIYS